MIDSKYFHQEKYSFPYLPGDSIIEKPPKAVEKEKLLIQEFPEKNFKDIRVDEYYWLRSDSRDDPQVLAHLKDENNYFEKIFSSPNKILIDTLYAEMKSRIKENDFNPPERDYKYFYYRKYLERKQYPLYCRQSIEKVPNCNATIPSIHDTIDPNSKEEQIIMDSNERCQNVDSYQMASLDVSPNTERLAFTEDLTGKEQYCLFIKDLISNNVFKLTTQNLEENCSSELVWGSDNVVYFLTKDNLNRPFKLYKSSLVFVDRELISFSHCLIYHEKDIMFSLNLSRSDSKTLIYLSSSSSVTSETFSISLADERYSNTLLSIYPRTHSVEYSVADIDGKYLFLMLTDSDHHSKLLATERSTNTVFELIPYRSAIHLEEIKTFQNHLVILERTEGLARISVYEICYDLTKKKWTQDTDWSCPIVHLLFIDTIRFDEEAYSVSNIDGYYFSKILRFTYSSLNVPMTIYDYDMTTKERAIKKRQEVLGGFCSSNYLTKRTWATSEDGKKVPISYCYHINACLFPAPVYLDGYGSYEICNEATFSSTMISLLDRGIIYAIAHVRGGGEMGRMWYENGKFLQKHNTWKDFYSCITHLVNEKIAQKGNIVCEGASAGGLLIGASLNEFPEDTFSGAINKVGFVDVLTTMSDDSIPLTATEWEEWGNPTSSLTYYNYIKSYSPYDQIKNSFVTQNNVPRKKKFPPILATAGLNDPRVGYWEPAKWVQRIRKHDFYDGRNILFKCLLESGHFSKSGRFSRLEEASLEFAFALTCFLRKKIC